MLQCVTISQKGLPSEALAYRATSDSGWCSGDDGPQARQQAFDNIWLHGKPGLYNGLSNGVIRHVCGYSAAL